MAVKDREGAQPITARNRASDGTRRGTSSKPGGNTAASGVTAIGERLAARANLAACDKLSRSG